MCGIVGYVGTRRAEPILIEGLKKLEYRGYDSAGIALLHGGEFTVVKRKGRVRELEGGQPLDGTVGIGHTRWATHGAPSWRNAHPHAAGKFVLVHNGIVENYAALKRELVTMGVSFQSDTDSEVIVRLIDLYYEGDVMKALKRATDRLTGSYALAVLCLDCPDTVACARNLSPLIVGRSAEGCFVASDIPAIADDGVDVFVLNDGEFALLSRDRITIYDNALHEIEREKTVYDAAQDVPEKGGYRHFMRKEMAEIPAAVRDSTVHFDGEEYALLSEVLRSTEYVQIVACGTAYHSGIAAKYAIEELARIPVEVCIASEYRYRNPVVPHNTLVLAISQSGETADTIAAARLARERGAYVVAVTNVPYSSLTGFTDSVLPTRAGREIAVAATKSFNAQLAALYSLAREIAELKRRATLGEGALSMLPQRCAEALEASEAVRGWTPHFTSAQSAYFIGRGADYCAAIEGSLKLKEISYLPSEGYPAGELKHGTLALIGEDTPVIAVLTGRAVAEKTMNAVSEVAARGAKVFLITSLPEYTHCKEVTDSIVLPECEEIFSPIVSVIPLQMLAYHTALAFGNDPDKPRNLAKSVTVE